MPPPLPVGGGGRPDARNPGQLSNVLRSRGSTPAGSCDPRPARVVGGTRCDCGITGGGGSARRHPRPARTPGTRAQGGGLSPWVGGNRRHQILHDTRASDVHHFTAARRIVAAGWTPLRHEARPAGSIARSSAVHDSNDLSDHEDEQSQPAAPARLLVPLLTVPTRFHITPPGTEVAGASRPPPAVRSERAAWTGGAAVGQASPRR